MGPGGPVRRRSRTRGHGEHTVRVRAARSASSGRCPVRWVSVNAMAFPRSGPKCVTRNMVVVGCVQSRARGRRGAEVALRRQQVDLACNVDLGERRADGSPRKTCLPPKESGGPHRSHTPLAVELVEDQVRASACLPPSRRAALLSTTRIAVLASHRAAVSLPWGPRRALRCTHPNRADDGQVWPNSITQEREQGFEGNSVADWQGETVRREGICARVVENGW